MHVNRVKALLAICGLLSGGVLLLDGERILSASPQSASAPAVAPGATPKFAEEQYKNIKVLKGIPADQVIPSMQFITASLGVDCEYCHVPRAMDKDDKKHKLVARQMITMMMAINKDNFEGRREVTCYSCHRGAADPIGTPVITEALPKTETGEDGKTPLPAAEQLFDKYLAAAGGADALHKITSRIQKGTVTLAGAQSSAIEVYSKAPDKRISYTHLSAGESVTAFDGKQGWLSVPGRVHIMSAAENDAAHLDADLYFPINAKSLYAKFVVTPGEKIDGRDTYLVTGREESKPPLRLYFDQQSGLLLRMIRYAESPLGRNPTETDYADYRNVDGAKIPFRWQVARPGNRFTVQIDQVQQNVPVDDSRFAPAPSPASSRPTP